MDNLINLIYTLEKLRFSSENFSLFKKFLNNKKLFIIISDVEIKQEEINNTSFEYANFNFRQNNNRRVNVTLNASAYNQLHAIAFQCNVQKLEFTTSNILNMDSSLGRLLTVILNHFSENINCNIKMLERDITELLPKNRLNVNNYTRESKRKLKYTIILMNIKRIFKRININNIFIMDAYRNILSNKNSLHELNTGRLISYEH